MHKTLKAGPDAVPLPNRFFGYSRSAFPVWLSIDVIAPTMILGHLAGFDRQGQGEYSSPLPRGQRCLKDRLRAP